MDDMVQLRQYVTILMRRWWLIVLGVVVTAAIGYGISRLQSPIYQAKTTLIVGRAIQTANPNRQEIEASQLLARTYADIVRRQPVLQGAVEALDLSIPWQKLRGQVQVDLVGDTQLLEITVEAEGSPENARAIADEIARQLILQSSAALQKPGAGVNRVFAQEQLTTLQANIEAGQAKLKELETAMAAAPSTREKQALHDEISALESLIVDWQTNYARLVTLIAEQTSPDILTTIEPAQADADPVRPRTRLNTALASIVGLFIASAFALAWDRMHITLRSADDLVYMLGLTYLGAIGRIKGKRYTDKVITAHEPFSLVAEAYRFIRSNIQFISADRPVKSIMVTSPGPGDGKSITAVNLGVAMAQAGFKTILVDADMRRPVLHKILEMPNQSGLTDLLCSPQLNVDGLLRDCGVENLKVITSGALAFNPSELLSSQRMDQLLAGLNAMADVVLFDSPPALAVADAAVLSTQVDGVVLVINAGKTQRDAARRAIATLQQVGAKVLGGVLNRITDKRGRYGYDYNYSPSEISRQSGLPEGVKRLAPWTSLFASFK